VNRGRPLVVRPQRHCIAHVHDQRTRCWLEVTPTALWREHLESRPRVGEEHGADAVIGVGAEGHLRIAQHTILDASFVEICPHGHVGVIDVAREERLVEPERNCCDGEDLF